MERLAKNVEIRRIVPDATAATTFILAAGTSDVNTGTIDTRGYNELTIIFMSGTMAASSSIDLALQYSDNDSDWTAVTSGTTAQVSATDDNKVTVVNIADLQHRYYRLAVTRGDGGNATIDGVIALLSKPVQAGVTQGSTVDDTLIMTNV